MQSSFVLDYVIENWFQDFYIHLAESGLPRSNSAANEYSHRLKGWFRAAIGKEKLGVHMWCRGHAKLSNSYSSHLEKTFTITYSLYYDLQVPIWTVLPMILCLQLLCSPLCSITNHTGLLTLLKTCQALSHFPGRGIWNSLYLKSSSSSTCMAFSHSLSLSLHLELANLNLLLPPTYLIPKKTA